MFVDVWVQFWVNTDKLIQYSCILLFIYIFSDFIFIFGDVTGVEANRYQLIYN